MIGMNKLEERFGFSPFSVLRTMNSHWLDQKRKWESLGIKGEIGREGTTAHSFNTKEWASDKGKTGADHNTSLFDPFLCELMYHWFTPHEASIILDPFCGGPPRGIVAAHMGHHYLGTDLNQQQIEANYLNLEKCGLGDKDGSVKWTHADGRAINTVYGLTFGDETALVDMVFTCPPYGDLELYTDNPLDLSRMSYRDFIIKLVEILFNAWVSLKDNRFMVVVVSDFRDKKTGLYRGFPSELTYRLKTFNIPLYNEFILVNSEGTLPFRITKQFSQHRKAGKMHQNVLVFLKGDPRKFHGEFQPLVDDNPADRTEWI
tara:strand:+ start:1845 stop:2795 length:951 start_codon:yes stop_codon:yes gene_type:complete